MQSSQQLHSSILQLRHDLTYQKHLFDASRKKGANFGELKKIHLRIRELENDMQVLEKHRLRERIIN